MEQNLRMKELFYKKLAISNAIKIEIIKKLEENQKKFNKPAFYVALGKSHLIVLEKTNILVTKFQ